MKKIMWMHIHLKFHEICYVWVLLEDLSMQWQPFCGFHNLQLHYKIYSKWYSFNNEAYWFVPFSQTFQTSDFIL